ncbi:18674_t:CDS:2 [Gigaspora rosea]|nr:18674_t:CDS:2 [Gigaspora rosea]
MVTDVEGQANNMMFSLEIGDEFGDWDLTIKYVEKHAPENGFEVIKRQIQKIKINFYLSDGAIRVTSMHKEHNYLLPKGIQNISANFCHLSSEMLEEVEFLVNIGCSAGPIIC